MFFTISFFIGIFPDILSMVIIDEINSKSNLRSFTISFKLPSKVVHVSEIRSVRDFTVLIWKRLQLN